MDRPVEAEAIGVKHVLTWIWAFHFDLIRTAKTPKFVCQALPGLVVSVNFFMHESELIPLALYDAFNVVCRLFFVF